MYVRLHIKTLFWTHSLHPSILLQESIWPTMDSTPQSENPQPQNPFKRSRSPGHRGRGRGNSRGRGGVRNKKSDMGRKEWRYQSFSRFALSHLPLSSGLTNQVEIQSTSELVTTKRPQNAENWPKRVVRSQSTRRPSSRKWKSIKKSGGRRGKLL